MNDPQLRSRLPDSVDVLALLGLLWRHKYVVLAVAVFFTAGSVVLALTATKVYRAEVVLTQVNESATGAVGTLMSRLGGVAGLAGIGLGGDTGTAREALAVLHSRDLAADFIMRNDLVPHLVPQKGDGALWFAVKAFREKVLSIQPDEESGTIVVRVDWTDPEIAARWANDFVALANEQLRTRALKEANSKIKYLQEQIAQTNAIEIQKVMYNLIESETKTLMLANARKEYAFTIVDPAVKPEMRIKPRRTLIVIIGGVLGSFFGALVALSIDLIRRFRAWNSEVMSSS